MDTRTVEDHMETLGQGTLVSGGSVRGTAKRVKLVEDVVELLTGESELSHVILVTESASAATVLPLLSEVAGIVCTMGGPTSHLATVARDYSLTCVVGAKSLRLDSVDGMGIVIDDAGNVLMAGQP
jgi:phosphoenolpyruvate-protein kinase (PTS system EI component)